VLEALDRTSRESCSAPIPWHAAATLDSRNAEGAPVRTIAFVPDLAGQPTTCNGDEGMAGAAHTGRALSPKSMRRAPTVWTTASTLRVTDSDSCAYGLP
jgi:hypothetical protein